MKNKIFLLLVVSVFILNGCAVVFQKGRRSDVEKIETLKEELESLRHAREVLERRLATELENQDVRLEMAEKGLVITFVAEVLFDSGKADIKKDSETMLDKVARILKEESKQYQWFRDKINFDLHKNKQKGAYFYSADYLRNTRSAP